MQVMTKSHLGSFRIKSAERGEVSAVIATFNTVDRDGDYTLPTAVREGAKVYISRWNHSAVISGEPPVGIGYIRKSGNSMHLDTQYWLDTERGREAFEVVKRMGDILEWSYGYFVRDQEVRRINGRQVNVLKDLHIYEASPVYQGAGIGTHTVDVKRELESIRRSAGLDHNIELRTEFLQFIASGVQ